MKTRLSFVRKNAFQIENMLIVSFKHKASLSTPQNVIEAFQRAITKWVENTEEGKTFWDYSAEDLNIDDILEEYQNKTLNSLLRLEGIKKWKPIYQLIDQEEISYDKVLANPQTEI